MFSEVEILEEFVDQCKFTYDRGETFDLGCRRGVYTAALTEFDRLAIYHENQRERWRIAANKWRAKQPIVKLRKKSRDAQAKWVSKKENREKKNLRMRKYMREYNNRPEIKARNQANRAKKLEYLKSYRRRIKCKTAMIMQLATMNQLFLRLRSICDADASSISSD